MENNLIYIRREADAFPRRLLHMADPPKGLYVLGTLPADDLPSVAIVGSRMCSPYGRKIAYRFGMDLAAHGIQVISGMALGIDGHAHEGALAANGRTFAVLGCGADICYPEKNRKLYQEIPKNGGVLSEEPSGTPPLPYNFPKRNRIISALSDLVIVVEARKKSGSLITADSALEQGRTVMAVPGRVGDALAEGTNHLIAQGAEIAWSVQAVLDVLLPLHERQMNAQKSSVWPSSGEQLSLELEPAGSETSPSPGEDTSENNAESRNISKDKSFGVPSMDTYSENLSKDKNSEASLTDKNSLSSSMDKSFEFSPKNNLFGCSSLEERLVFLQKNGQLTPLAADICRILETDSRTFDEIAEELQTNVSSLSSALLELRLGGLIEENSGSYSLA